MLGLAFLALTVSAAPVFVGCSKERNVNQPSLCAEKSVTTAQAVPASPEASTPTKTASSAVKAAQEEFQKLFIPVGDSYYSRIVGEYNRTVIGDWKAEIEIEERKGVQYAVEEYQVSEAEKLNGIAGKGMVIFSSAVSRRFHPDSGWTQWRDHQPMVEVRYVLGKDEDVSTKVYVDEPGFGAPSAKHLRDAGISDGSESYWKQHLHEQLEPAFNKLKENPPKAPQDLAAAWLNFLNEWGTTRNPFFEENDELLLAAEENYAKAMQKWWLAQYQDESKKPQFRGVTPEAKSAGHAHFLEMQKVVFGDGSGLSADFKKLPSFTNSIGVTFVWCPPATDDDKTLPGFWISESEITELQWSRLTGAPTDHPNLPVRKISWQESVDFCETLTTFEQEAFAFPTQLKYSLPTQETWERACFADAEKRSDRPDNLLDLGWFKENSNGELQPVKSKTPNKFGIYDMRGNVAEWILRRATYGHYDGRYVPTHKGDSFRDTTEDHSPRSTSCPSNGSFSPDFSRKSSSIGFRIVIQP